MTTRSPRGTWSTKLSHKSSLNITQLRMAEHSKIIRRSVRWSWSCTLIVRLLDYSRWPYILLLSFITKPLISQNPERLCSQKHIAPSSSTKNSMSSIFPLLFTKAKKSEIWPRFSIANSQSPLSQPSFNI